MITARFPQADDDEVNKLTVSLYDYANDVNNELAAMRRQTPQVDAFAIQATTSGGGAFAWRNPYPQTIVITRVVIHIRELAFAATMDVGTAPAPTTSSSTLLTALNLSASAGAFDNIADIGANGAPRRILNQNEYITGTITGNPVGLKANCYVEYYFALPVL